MRRIMIAFGCFALMMDLSTQASAQLACSQGACQARPAYAQVRYRFRYRERGIIQTQAAYPYQWTVPIQATTPPATNAAPSPQAASQPIQTTGDPYGFTSWLNATRAGYGLGPVMLDASLIGWASVNNSHQLARGLGHFVMGSARRQNSGMGSLGSVQMMWLASPAHRAALLDPFITRIGIAGAGSYWTFSAY